MAQREPASLAAKGTNQSFPSAPHAPQGADPRVEETIEAFSLPVAILAAPDGKILYANRALLDTLGFKRERLTHRGWEILFPRIEERRRIKTLHQRGGEEGGVRGLLVQGRRRRGEAIWLSVWQQRFTYGGRECLLTLLQDVTRDKSERSALEEQIDALEQLLRSSEQERELIAYDIHDGVIQEMTAALMHVQAAARSLADGRPVALEPLKKVDHLLREGISEARRLMDGVRQPDLDELGLLGALELLAMRISDSKGVEVGVKHRLTSNRFSSQAETFIYRIVQEALNNVWRHSKSTRARVELVQNDRGIRVTVKDWGAGFEPDQVDSTRFGLAGIRQRVRLLGGSLRIRSAPGRGCVVRATIPASAALPMAPTS